MDLSRAELVGEGMEGSVYRLEGGLIGKAWRERGADELRPLIAFYEELAAQGLPFATPLIVEVAERDGRALTVERELPGTPLSAAGLAPAAAHDAVVAVVKDLAATTAGPATRALLLMGERIAARPSLPELVRRRAAAFRPVLAAAVPGFDALLDRLLERLDGAAETGSAERIVHGDICPPNILVDAAGRPTALLDWGLLTTAGDNAFDAATAAAFFDMYGPEAAVHHETLAGRLAETLGYDREWLLVQLGAYAVASACAYDPEGRDGHFAWCVDVLARADVRSALGVA
ncbi:aminoglycoside phosphotransferase family protein [Streptomyces sp. 8K308]|uniref:phosphotransferase n=1 Tax=Streptomyces sp. 8K308 TaxID=2530388 RepID=UPI001049922B|nr:phosphotransferase [Streptomyces sp. 8K308]TDC23370.1 aminoglycoside phosphotransferase family protein [Streptomyces sp. 8K308]